MQADASFMIMNEWALPRCTYIHAAERRIVINDNIDPAGLSLGHPLLLLLAVQCGACAIHTRPYSPRRWHMNATVTSVPQSFMRPPVCAAR